MSSEKPPATTSRCSSWTYAALDASAAAMKDAKSDFGRLIRDSTQFQDFDLQAPWSSSLLKNVIDASVFDPKQ